MELAPGEVGLVRPKAWSMRTELRRGSEAIAVLSPPQRFGRSATARVGERTYVLTKGGPRSPQVRLRELGSEEDLAVLEHTGAARAHIVWKDEEYELTLADEGWELRSPRRGLLLTVRRDPRDPSQGRVAVDVVVPDVLLLLLAWFAVRELEC